MLKKGLVLFFSGFAVFAITAFQPQGTAQAQAGIVLRVNSEGGSYEGSQSELMLYDDGFGVFRGRQEEKKFTVDPTELSNLLALIDKADFDAILMNKFTGICPTAYDGVQHVYTFFTPQGEKIIDSCQTAIDEQSPLFRTIRKIQVMAYRSGN